MTDKSLEAEADAALEAELAELEGTESADPPPAEEAVEPEGDASAPTDAPASENTPEEGKPDPEPEVVPAPVGFSDEDRAWFATLPPDAQRAIARRESDRESEFGRKSQEIAESRKQYEALDKVISDHRERWQLNGMSDAQAVQQLLAAEQYLQKDPVAGLQFLARQYGVDLGKLNTRTQTPNPYQKLQSEMQEMRNMLTQREQAQRSSQQEQMVQQIEQWGHAQDNGKPLRPYFDQVQSDMVPIMGRLKQTMPGASMNELLEAAYDRAVYANPDVRSTVLDAEMRAAQAKRDAEAKAKAQKARAAASSPSSDSGGDSPKRVKSIDQALNAALEDMSAR